MFQTHNYNNKLAQDSLKLQQIKLKLEANGSVSIA